MFKFNNKDIKMMSWTLKFSKHFMMYFEFNPFVPIFQLI